MNWSKAANLLIICLIILNLALGLMLNLQKQQYILSSEQEDSVTRLLSKNNIEVNDINRDFAPMRAINMTVNMYDNETMKELFLGKSTDIKRTTEFNTIKYTKGGETLIISSNMIEYANELAGGDIKLTVESAKKAAQDYYKSILMKKFTGFKFDSAYETDETIIVDYRGFYKNNIMYSNFIKFTVTAQGIISVICEYQKPEGYYGDRKQLCSPDEALVAFMYEARKEIDEKLIVEKMDMVYYPVEAEAQVGTVVRAIPFYRVYVKGKIEPFLINAYTNSIS